MLSSGVERTIPPKAKEVIITSCSEEELLSDEAPAQVLLADVNAEVVLTDGINILDLIRAEIEVNDVRCY